MRHHRAALSLLLLALVSFCALPLTAEPPASLAARIHKIIQRPEFWHAFWGIEFFDLDAGRPVYQLNADKLFIPGSTTKLLTEGTALALLGPDHRFTTRVYRTGPVTDGVLEGDLVLVASGDPNLSGRIRPDGTLAFENKDHSYGGAAVPGDPLLVVRQLAEQVAAHGIKTVRGRVRVDVSLFPEGERELGTGAFLSPIVINDNFVDVTISPGAAPDAAAVLTVSPASSYVQLVNQLKTGPAGSGVAIEPDDVTNADGSHTVTVTGTFPMGKEPASFPYAVPEPSRFAVAVLTEALAEKGVRIEPDAAKIGAAGDTPKPPFPADQVVAEHVSQPFREEVKITLKVSQNLHASNTPFVVGALLRKEPTQTFFDLERDFLTAAGLDLSGAQQADGAGGDAHYTPAFMVSYLAMMAKRPDFAIFHAGLPILGRDGTLAETRPARRPPGTSSPRPAPTPWTIR